MEASVTPIVPSAQSSRTKRMQAQLQQCFPGAEHMEVINESSGHQVPVGSETHFKVCLVDAGFAGLSRVQRHQKVYTALAEEMQSGLHALALHLYVAEEWQQIQSAPASPVCQSRR